MSLDDALNAPRVCTNGEFFYCDTDLPESARAGLESMGYSGLSTKLSIARPAGLRIQGDLREGSAECRGDAASINDCAALCTGLGTVPEASS